MESWREELYHAGIFSNLRTRAVKAAGNVKNAVASKSSGSKSSNGKGREWANHKYIRKEGTRYIYPEDLKKTSRKPNNSQPSGNGKSGDKKYKTNAAGYKPNSKYDTHQKNWDKRQYNAQKQLVNKYSDKNNGKKTYGYRPHENVYVENGNVTFLSGKSAKKAIKNIENVLSIYRTNGKASYDGNNKEFIASYLTYKNGKQFFDSLEIKESYLPHLNGNRYTDVEYAYTYGYFSQAKNAGKKFVNRLKDAGWNKFRDSDSISVGGAHKANQNTGNVEIEWPHKADPNNLGPGVTIEEPQTWEEYWEEYNNKNKKKKK